MAAAKQKRLTRRSERLTSEGNVAFSHLMTVIQVHQKDGLEISPQQRVAGEALGDGRTEKEQMRLSEVTASCLDPMSCPVTCLLSAQSARSLSSLSRIFSTNFAGFFPCRPHMDGSFSKAKNASINKIRRRRLAPCDGLCAPVGRPAPSERDEVRTLSAPDCVHDAPASWRRVPHSSVRACSQGTQGTC